MNTEVLHLAAEYARLHAEYGDAVDARAAAVAVLNDADAVEFHAQTAMLSARNALLAAIEEESK